MPATLDNIAEAIERARQENRQDFKEVKKTQSNHGERLAKVEEWKGGHSKAHWGIIGAVAGSAGIVATVLAIFGG